MASCFPELEPSYSGSVGPVMLSGLVATLQLKRESVRPWKCINGHPRGKRHVHQFWAPDEKTEVLDGLCRANICENYIIRADGINIKKQDMLFWSCCLEHTEAAEELLLGTEKLGLRHVKRGELNIEHCGRAIAQFCLKICFHLCLQVSFLYSSQFFSSLILVHLLISAL